MVLYFALFAVQCGSGLSRLVARVSILSTSVRRAKIRLIFALPVVWIGRAKFYTSSICIYFEVYWSENDHFGLMRSEPARWWRHRLRAGVRPFRIGLLQDVMFCSSTSFIGLHGYTQSETVLLGIFISYIFCAIHAPLLFCGYMFDVPNFTNKRIRYLTTVCPPWQKRTKARFDDLHRT